MEFPRTVACGRGEIGKMKMMNCTILCDRSLEEAGRKVEETTGGRLELVYTTDAVEIEKLAANIRSEYIIGVGGGRTIDAAKYAATVAGKKLTVIPTALSNDGIASSIAILTEGGKRTTKQCVTPAMIIADYDVISRSPYRLTAAGCGDVISNISAVADWKLAEKERKEGYNRFIGDLSLLSAKVVANHAGEIKSGADEGLEALFWSLVMSGFAMNFYGSSRPCSGSEHAFSHTLDAMLGGKAALHGEQVCLGTIISLYLHEQDWEAVRKLMKEIGLPVNSREIGIEKEILIKALAAAKDMRDRHTILNKAGLDEKDAEEVLKKTGII